MNSLLKKILSVGMMVAVVAVVGGVVVSPKAHAATMTLEQLQAQIAQLEQQLAQYKSQLESVQGGKTTGATTAIKGCSITSFDRSLKVGMTGDDVKCLQIVLNSDSDTQVAKSGAGSPGNETSYFGALTKAAVVKFQEKYASDILAPYGLTAGTGYVGKTTRAKLNKLLSATGSETGGTTASGTGSETTGAGTPAAGTAASYTNETDCTAAGYYWYNDACNETAQQQQKQEAVATGTLSVSLADDNPVSKNVPTGVVVNFLRFKLTAGAKDVNVNSIKLTASGLGNSENIDNVSLYDGDSKIGNSKNINSERVATFVFATPLTVKANTSKEITVKATTAKAGYYALGIAAATDIVSDGVIVGSFPITGSTMSSVEGVGIGSISFSAVSKSVNAQVGSDNIDLVDFTATAGNNEDINLSGLRLKNAGTLGKDELGTVSLLHGSTVIATANMDSDKYITFSFDPILIQRGNTENFSVKADIESGSSGNTIKLYIKDPSDVTAIGKSYGYQVPVDTTGWSMDASIVTLTGGQLQINMNRSAVPFANVLPGTKNVVVGQLEMTAVSEGVKVSSLELTLNFAGTGFNSDDVENVELRDVNTGVVIDLSGPSAPSATAKYKTNDEIDLTKGVKKVYEVRLDTKSTAPNNGVLNVALLSSDIDAEGVISGSQISNIVPSSVTGANITITKSGLEHTVKALNDAYPIAGSVNTPIYKAILTASKSSDVTLNSITFKDNSVDLNTSFSNDDVNKATLVIGGNNVESLSGQISANSSGPNTLTFSGLNYTIAAGQTATIYLDIDLNNTLNATDSFKVNVTNIQAKDKDGKTVDVNEDLVYGPAVHPAKSGEMDILLSSVADKANKDRYVLAGAASDYMGLLKFEAIKENIKVKDFYLIDPTASSTKANNVIKSLNKVQLVHSDGSLVAESSNFKTTSDGLNVLVLFSGIDHVVSLGTEPVYIKVVTNGIGPGSEQVGVSGSNFQFKIYSSSDYPIDCEGMSSNASFDVEGSASPVYGDGTSNYSSNAETKEATLTGVKVTNLENVMSNTTLSNGSQVIYKIRVSVDSGNNLDGTASPLKAALKTLKLKLSTDLAATPTDITISRDGGSESAVSLTVNSDDELQTGSDGYIDMTKLDTDSKIATGYADFIVKASASDVSGKYLQVKLENTNTDITWNDGANTTDFTGVRLDKMEVDGNNLNN